VVEVVTVPVDAEVEAGVDAVVAVGAVTTVVAAAVAGVTVVVVEDAIAGESGAIAIIRLILHNLSRFGSAIDQP